MNFSKQRYENKPNECKQSEWLEQRGGGVARGRKGLLVVELVKKET